MEAVDHKDEKQCLRQALRAADARFHAIVDRSADGVVVVREDGVIRFVNPAAERLLGRPAQRLLGGVFGVPIVPGEVTEIDLLHKGGASRSAEMRVTATQWQGQPAYLATLRDVTERKRREQETQEAVRRRDLFLASLSHELRNPLGAIVSANHILARAADNPATVERSREVIDRQGRLMKRLLDDLLDVARISCGKIELRTEPLDLRELVESAVATIREAAEEKSLRIELRMDAEQPVPVDADPARMQQVLVNLLTNAVRYSNPGGLIELSAQREEGRAVLRVRDNGIGITADKMPEIFEPFQQGDVTLDRRDVGLGIGLSLVQSLVQLHGGEVRASSEGVNRGSEFTVKLPLGRSVEVIQTPEGGSTMDAVPEHRIMIVEDNENAREMLQSLLELEGHDVQSAADAHEALELMELSPPDVALVDIGLPDIDGFELARRLRANSQYDSVFLIALTGYGQPEDRRAATEAGFDAHLVKPLDMDAFCRLLRDGCRRPGRCQAGQAE